MVREIFLVRGTDLKVDHGARRHRWVGTARDGQAQELGSSHAGLPLSRCRPLPLTVQAAQPEAAPMILACSSSLEDYEKHKRRDHDHDHRGEDAQLHRLGPRCRVPPRPPASNPAACTRAVRVHDTHCPRLSLIRAMSRV
jgi:hypothetical protein